MTTSSRLAFVIVTTIVFLASLVALIGIGIALTTTDWWARKKTEKVADTRPLPAHYDATFCADTNWRQASDILYSGDEQGRLKIAACLDVAARAWEQP